MTDLLELSNISYAFGSFYFYYTIFEQIRIQQCVQIMLSLCFYFLPYELKSDILCIQFSKSYDSKETQANDSFKL
jgi:hypothetical protein